MVKFIINVDESFNDDFNNQGAIKFLVSLKADPLSNSIKFNSEEVMV